MIQDRLPELLWVAAYRRIPQSIPKVAPVKRAREERSVAPSTMDVFSRFTSTMETVAERVGGETFCPKTEVIVGLSIPSHIVATHRWMYVHLYLHKEDSQASATTWTTEVNAFITRNKVAFNDTKYHSEMYHSIDACASYIAYHGANVPACASKEQYRHMYFMMARLVALMAMGSAKSKAGEASEAVKDKFALEWAKPLSFIHFERWFRG